MKRLSYASFVVMCLAILMFAACTAGQVKEGADAVKEGAGAAASILPPPWGVIAALIAGVAGIVSNLAASRIKAQAVSTGTDPHPIANFISSHSWIYPSIVGLIGIANSMGWIHVSPAEIGTLATALGVATGVQVVADNHAESKAPATKAPGT